jgi:hypothetical protein
MGVRTMHRCVTARTPAGALSQQECVRDVANEKFGPALDLGMAFQTKVGIRLDQQFAVYRAMRLVTNDATFPQGLVFEDVRPGFFTVALGAAFVVTRHGQAARRFENIRAMRIVALRTVHPALDKRMVLRQVEFGLGFQVALKTCRGILAWIDDEFAASASGFDMFAARTVARLATALAR